MRLHVLTGLNPLTLRAQQAQIAAQQEATRTRMGQNAELTSMRNMDGSWPNGRPRCRPYGTSPQSGTRVYGQSHEREHSRIPSPRVAAASTAAEDRVAQLTARREDSQYQHIAAEVDHELAESRRPPAAGQDARPIPEWLRQPVTVTPGPENTSTQRVTVSQVPESRLRDQEIARRLAAWRSHLGRANGGAQDLEGGGAATSAPAGQAPGGQGGQQPAPSNGQGPPTGQAPPSRPQALAGEQFGSLLEETQGRLDAIRASQRQVGGGPAAQGAWQRLEETAAPVWQERNALSRIQPHAPREHRSLSSIRRNSSSSWNR